MLPDIIAKTLTIIDELLSIFVETHTVTHESGCQIPYMTAGLTDCGEDLVDSLGNLIAGLVRLGSDTITSLTVTPMG